MAVCVIGATTDTDAEDRVVPACNVHCYYAPCPMNGEPASTTPLEATDEQGREKALQFWDARTKRQRPLVLHHGAWLDDPLHDGASCWCGPDLLPAVSVCTEAGLPTQAMRDEHAEYHRAVAGSVSVLPEETPGGDR